MNKEDFEKIKENISDEKTAAGELMSLFNSIENAENREEINLISAQIERIKKFIYARNYEIGEILGERKIKKEESEEEIIPEKKVRIKKEQVKIGNIPKNIKLTKLEKETIKRIKTGGKTIKEKKQKKPNAYAKISSRFFGKLSESLMKKELFSAIGKDLSKTNIELTVQSYIASSLFTAMLTLIVSIMIFIFLLFFKISSFPSLTPVTENILQRLTEVIWIVILLPAAVLVFMLSYPSLERKSEETKMDQELPFAVIHMATISGALVEPSKIFSIILATKEYPNLQPQLIKLLNFINIYGYDLVNALRKISSVTPSKKLADLFNSLAVTINSGGSLPVFFNKRADSLLFEYKLDREKYIKFSETFMDIYISAVIAAPMMLMLLLMIMKISGLGISLSNSMISLIMVLGVSIINIVFLIFLHLKQQGQE